MTARIVHELSSARIAMITLHHHPFCPHSRFIRLVLAEFGVEPTLVEQRPWERRREFLLLNAEGATPVLSEESAPSVPGADVIAEYLDETRGLALGDRRLLPEDPLGRVEVRRLMRWFNVKFYAEASHLLVTEKIYKRYMNSRDGGGAPDMDAMRVGARQSALSSALHRLSRRGAQLARRRQAELRRPGGGGPSVLRRLSRRRAVGRERDGQGMVRADQVPAVVPAAAGREPAGRERERELRRSRLLSGLKARARALGFDACRIAPASQPPGARDGSAAWLAAGSHGDMAWMAETFARRADPKILWPEAQQRRHARAQLRPAPSTRSRRCSARNCGAISVYARNRDYHEVVKGKLKTLAAWLVAAARPEPIDVKVFVDTAPVMEKPLAAAAGLGWQGKHTNLVCREFGSWLFLGAIFTDLDLPPDAAERDHCG